MAMLSLFYRRRAAAGLLLLAVGCQRGPYQPAAHLAPVTSQPVSKSQGSTREAQAVNTVRKIPPGP